MLSSKKTGLKNSRFWRNLTFLKSVKIPTNHHDRRRIYTEVVAPVWGEECIQFLAVLAILPIGRFWRKRIKPFVSNHPGATHLIIQIVLCKTVTAAINCINFPPPPHQKQRRHLPSLLYKSFFDDFRSFLRMRAEDLTSFIIQSF